jgi:hypothetical protein
VSNNGCQLAFRAAQMGGIGGQAHLFHSLAP